MTRVRIIGLFVAILVVGAVAPAISRSNLQVTDGTLTVDGATVQVLDDQGNDVTDQLALPFTVDSMPTQALVFDTDTVLTEPLVLRPGDTVELQNGARLSFGAGGYLDSQGTPTSTWSHDGNGNITKNLDRDIRVFGEGDIMFMAGSLPSTILFTEFDLQPTPTSGHYPLHWHKAGTSPDGSLVEGVVVKNSTNRCIVPHGVTGVTIRDTICDNIINDAIWWDPPTPPPGSNKIARRTWVEDDSFNITIDRVLVDGVRDPSYQTKSPNQWYRNFGFELYCGAGNTIKNSLAANVGGKSHSGGYYWPSSCNLHEPGNVWTFENNTTVNSWACAYTWQNGGAYPAGPHVMDGLDCVNTTLLGAGAYTMSQEWRDVGPVPTTEVKAINTKYINADLGVVKLLKPQARGPVTIIDSVLERIHFNESGTKAGKGHRVTVTNSGITCDDWTGTPAADSTLTIDGVVCDLGG